LDSLLLTPYRYGISSFVCPARRPFHLKRLFDLIHDKFIVLQNVDQVIEEKEHAEDEDMADAITATMKTKKTMSWRVTTQKWRTSWMGRTSLRRSIQGSYLPLLNHNTSVIHPPKPILPTPIPSAQKVSSGSLLVFPSMVNGVKLVGY